MRVRMRDVQSADGILKIKSFAYKTLQRSFLSPQLNIDRYFSFLKRIYSNVSFSGKMCIFLIRKYDNLNVSSGKKKTCDLKLMLTSWSKNT